MFANNRSLQEEMYYIHIHCDEELLQWSLISNQKHGMTMPCFNSPQC